jgi:hypothetical protein
MSEKKKEANQMYSGEEKGFKGIAREKTYSRCSRCGRMLELAGYRYH